MPAATAGRKRRRQYGLPSLHGLADVSATLRAARPRGPWKFRESRDDRPAEVRHGSDLNLLIHEHGDTVADGTRLSRSCVTMKTVRPKLLLQVADQADRRRRRRWDRGPPWARPGTGSRDRAPARGPARRAFMPPDSSDGYFAPASAAQADQLDLQRRQLVLQLRAGRLVCSFIGTWTFSATVSELNSAPLWNSTPQRSCSSSAAGVVQFRRVLAQHDDLAGTGPDQADDRAQQHGLAGARTADHTQHFAPLNVEIEVVVNHLHAELGPQSANRNDGRCRRLHDQAA